MKAIRVPAALPAPVALLLLLASCAAPPPPAPAPAPPAPRPVAAPLRSAPPPPADWRDAPQTPGAWHWSNPGGRSTASFAAPGQADLVRLSCDGASRRTILWTNRLPAGSVPLVVTATSTRRLLTATADQAGGASAALPVRDPLLDAIAFSRGRFMLEMAGYPALYLPAWAEVGRVIEDCR